ncbi:MAG TPA: hypothetical protein ENK18_28675 [Deltaproteobacteria bacterium]|nr:hypothetical protein [Deltaproteobacteria bacterium]
MSGSVICATILHQAPDRGAAAAIVPVGLAWGAAVLALGSRIELRHWGWLLLAAALVRLPLVGTPPLLSDDLYRYLFEGLALAAGHNPFTEAPAGLPGLDDALRAQVNHPEIPTVYPPLALWWFRLLALAATPTAVQGATALLDLVVPPALLIATRRAWPAWIYALHPLPAIEAACGGHIDVPAIVAATVGVAAWRRGHRGGAWWALGLGGLLKLLPAVLLPALWRRLPRRQLQLVALLALATALALPVLPAGPALLQGAGAYASRWAFNGCVYPWLEPLGPAVRWPLVGLGASVGALALWRHTDPGEVWALVGAAFVLLSPTVHPWYVLWALVPSLLCGRRGWAWASLPLLGSYAVLLAYDPQTGQWAEAPWLWWITWPPALLLLALAYRSEPSATAP